LPGEGDEERSRIRLIRVLRRGDPGAASAAEEPSPPSSPEEGKRTKNGLVEVSATAAPFWTTPASDGAGDGEGESLEWPMKLAGGEGPWRTTAGTTGPSGDDIGS
jgi:hypothetical protein